MRPRVTITTIERGESVRGKPGVFGRAEVVDVQGETCAVTFSRLDGEERWYADSMWMGERPLFAHGAGERIVQKHALTGCVEKAVAREAAKRGL